MRIIRRSFQSLSSSTLLIGRTGENEATKLIIDISREKTEYPNAMFDLLLQLPESNDSYPVLFDIIDNELLYSFSEDDLCVSGFGRIELVLYGDRGEVVKTAIGRTRIEKSLMENNVYSGPIQKWVDWFGAKEQLINSFLEMIEASANEKGMEVVEHYSDLPYDGDINDVAIVMQDEVVQNVTTVSSETEAIPSGKRLTLSGEVEYKPDEFVAEVQRTLDAHEYFNVGIVAAGTNNDGIYAYCVPLSLDDRRDLNYEGYCDIVTSDPLTSYAIMSSLGIPYNKLKEVGTFIRENVYALPIFATYVFEPIQNAEIIAGGREHGVIANLSEGWNIITVEALLDDGSETFEVNGVISVDSAQSISDWFSIDTNSEYTIDHFSDAADNVLAGVLITTEEITKSKGLYVRRTDGWTNVFAFTSDDEGDPSDISPNQSEDTLIPLALNDTYNSLSLRDDWFDVPVYVSDVVSGYTVDGIPSLNIFTMGLFSDNTDADADFIRVVENTDYVTGRPMLLLRVQRNGTGYTCFPEAFHGITEDYAAGWYDDEDNAVSAPSLDGMTFGALEVCLEWYDDLSDLPLKAQLALDALSRMVNVSEAARGSLGVRTDMAQRYVGRLDGNRRYRRIASKDFALTFPTLAETETPSTIRLDLTCTQDVTLTLPRERLMDGGVLPNTRRGFHTLTFTYFPAAGKWSVGSVDRVVPQYWDDIPDEVTPFGDCTWAQIKSIATHGYLNRLGQWCIRRNNVEEVWFEIGDEKTITLSGGETWVLQIWDFNHDDLADGSGKAPFTIGMKSVTNTKYRMNTSSTKAGGWEVCYFRVHVLPTILETLPSDLQSTIAEVTKLSTPNDLSTIINTTDKLFLLSVSEMMTLNSETDNINEGTRYALFYSGADYGSTESWLRTSYCSYYGSRWRYSQGTNATKRVAADPSGNMAVRLAFCI